MEYIFLFCVVILVGFITGIIGAITGSGGIFAIPILIFFGLPPSTAIATERFSSIGQNFGAIIIFRKFKLVVKKYVIPFLIVILISTIINTFLLIKIKEETLHYLIIIIMIITLFFVIRYPKVGEFVPEEKRKHISKKKKLLGYSVLGLSNIFSSFLGGLGMIRYFIISYFFKLTNLEANATSRTAWVVSVAISSFYLGFLGYIDFTLAIPLFIGYTIGAVLGAKIEVAHGNKFIHYFYIVILIVAIIKCIFFI